MKRTEIQAADLYVLLQRDFRRRQAAGCPECYVQLPFRVDRAGEDSANWEVILPRACPKGCREIIEEIVEEYARQFDLKPEAAH